MTNSASSPESAISAQLAASGRAVPPFGHVEVVRIKRRSRKWPELLLFKGSPVSKHGVAKSVLITINEAGSGSTTPWLDLEKGRIHITYPSMEHAELQALLADPGSFLCYFWTSADGTKSLAWLLKSF